MQATVCPPIWWTQLMDQCSLDSSILLKEVLLSHCDQLPVIWNVIWEYIYMVGNIQGGWFLKHTWTCCCVCSAANYMAPLVFHNVHSPSQQCGAEETSERPVINHHMVPSWIIWASERRLKDDQKKKKAAGSTVRRCQGGGGSTGMELAAHRHQEMIFH